tara:strand:+ start:789 stop:1124 length:336 start_codon:yes stop_codon:yes gene_type:complete
MPEPIKKRRKKNLRNLDRNKSGREKTVLMEYGSAQNKKGKTVYMASPSITFKGKEEAKPQSYKQALEAGEVYVFKKEKRAERFAAGSWKKGKDKRDAMSAYRKKKRAEKNK